MFLVGFKNLLLNICSVVKWIISLTEEVKLAIQQVNNALLKVHG